MMMKGESTEVVNFKPTRDRDSCAWALVYSENAILVYTGAWIRQTKSIVMMIKEGLPKLCKFHDPPGQGFLSYGMASY